MLFCIILSVLRPKSKKAQIKSQQIMSMVLDFGTNTPLQSTPLGPHRIKRMQWDEQ